MEYTQEELDKVSQELYGHPYNSANATRIQQARVMCVIDQQRIRENKEGKNGKKNS